MTIGLIVAMDKEFEAIAKAWLSKTPTSRSEKVINGCRIIRLYPSEMDEVVLLRSGIGKVNAAMATMMLIEDGVNCIISSGVAGGADPTLTVGKVIVGTACLYHDVYCGQDFSKGMVQGEGLLLYRTDDGLLELASVLPIENKVMGQIATGDQFVDTKQAMGRILDDFPDVKAVDMESCAIAHICQKNNIPFISFRMLSDVVLNPSTLSYKDFWEKAPLQMASNTMRFVMKVLAEYTPV